MKIGFFGGSFNPVHNGHFEIVSSAIEKLGLEKIIVIPTFISPFKKDSNSFVADGYDRIFMCKLAFSGIPIVEVSDFEIAKAGVSYTFETIEHFRKIYPDDEFFLIIGSDMLLSFERWKNFEEIMRNCTIISASRIDKSANYPELLECKKSLEKFGEVVVMETSPFEISSTEIREKIMKNEETTCYLNENVVKYIVSKNIYGVLK